jgi:Mg2+-importing ATPase
LNSYFETGIKNPLDQAILSHDQPGISDFQKIDEIPFDFERRRVSVVVQNRERRLLITKGAPESILTICRTCQSNGSGRPFDEEIQRAARQTFEKASANGWRVLAVAFTEVPVRGDFQIEDEQGLTFAGFLTFADEPLETAAETLRIMAEDGVRVKILTGDNELVTRFVCDQVGLTGERIVAGDEIQQMNDAALAHIAEENNIFARVSPMQ